MPCRPGTGIIQRVEHHGAQDDAADRPACGSAGSVELRAGDGGGDPAIVRVSGALDLLLAPKLRQVVERAARLGPSLLVVDLSEVQFLGSMGMAELMRARQHGIPLRLVIASKVVERPLRVTRLIDDFEVFPTLSRAVAR